MKQLTDKQKAQLTKLVTKELKSAWGIDRNMVLHLAIDEKGKFHAGMWDSGTSVRWNEGYSPVNTDYPECDDYLPEVGDIVAELEDNLREEHEHQCVNLLEEAIDLDKITQLDVNQHWASYTPNTTTYGAIETPKATVKGFIEDVQDRKRRNNTETVECIYKSYINGNFTQVQELVGEAIDEGIEVLDAVQEITSGAAHSKFRLFIAKAVVKHLAIEANHDSREIALNW